MEIKTERIHRTYGEAGIPFSELTVSLPVFTGDSTAAEKFNRFYRDITAGLEQITESLLAKRGKARYEASDEPRRRFTHRPYCLELTVTHATAEGGITVKRILSLMHRGRCIYRETAEDLLLPSGRILPYKRKE